MEYYRLKITSLLILIFIGNFWVLSQKKYNIHTIEKDETLEIISKKYGISKDTLIMLNPDLKEGVKKGNIVIIPKAIKSKNNDDKKIEKLSTITPP